MITTPYFDELKILAIKTSSTRVYNHYMYEMMRLNGFSIGESLEIIENSGLLSKKTCKCCGVEMYSSYFRSSKKHKDGRSDFSIKCTIKRKKEQNKEIRKRRKDYETALKQLNTQL